MDFRTIITILPLLQFTPSSDTRATKENRVVHILYDCKFTLATPFKQLLGC